MNYYVRSSRRQSRIIINSLVPRGRESKYVWLENSTGQPCDNYKAVYVTSLWDLKSELKVNKVKEFCNKKMWEF